MYCSNCGAEINSNANFCYKCGQKNCQASNNTVPKGAVTVYKLTVCWAEQRGMDNKVIDIIIDNSPKYQINNGETIGIPIVEGVHNILFTDQVRKTPMDIIITGNTVLNVRCKKIFGEIVVEYGGNDVLRELRKKD